MLAAGLLSVALLTVGLLPIWLPLNGGDVHMNRYGQALAHSLALSSAGHLLHRDRIELAVVANRTVVLDEVAGIMFFDPGNEIIAISGSSDAGKHYTAPATLDDTITGYASVVLNPSYFTTPVAPWRWLASAFLILAAPFLSLLFLQLSARGNRSLPIVSVPETPVAPEKTFCLAVNLHNQMALDRAQKHQAVQDARDMANEVCAIHQGLVVEVPLRGVIVVLDQTAVDADQALSAAFLIGQLLAQFETAGQFRCYLDETTLPGSPADMDKLTREELSESTDIDTLLTLAALTKPDQVVLNGEVYDNLTEAAQTHCTLFAHPLLADMTDIPQFSCEQLDSSQQQWVHSQANLILGFNQASA